MDSKQGREELHLGGFAVITDDVCPNKLSLSRTHPLSSRLDAADILVQTLEPCIYIF